MQIKYDKVTINIHGNIDKEKIKESTIDFMRKVMKGRNQNGNNDTTGTIEEKQILVK